MAAMHKWHMSLMWKKNGKAALTAFKQHANKLFPYSRLAHPRMRDELALLTSYSTDTIYRLRYDSMTYDYVSPTIIKLLGYTPDEILHVSLRSIIQETRLINDAMKPISSYETLEKARRRGEVYKWQADYLMRTKDGRQIWVSDISYPWLDENGTLIGSVGSLRDITDRVEAEEAARNEIQRLVHYDPLTGLHNRRTFLQRMDSELKRVKRSHGDVSVLLIDMDHFKKVNADYGQQVGDLVIAAVSQLILQALRETDIAARIGGEEFGVILPDTPAAGAYWVAERIRTLVAQHIFHFGDEQLMGCTVSIGLTSAQHDHNLDANSLYALADSRLFIAKRTGRNQVSLDEVPTEVH